MTLDVINISKTYNTLGRKKVVFKNLSFTVPRGVNLGVIGANGSGKSTLLNMIAGATQPDTGRIVRDMTVSWPLGYAGGVQTNLSGKVNCRFLARLYGKDPDWVTSFVAEFSELEDYMDWPVKTYSSGMRSRLAFALSMAIDFECLLVDEGMSAGDQFFKGKAEAAIDERRKRSSLILVSHDLREVTRLCDWILVLGEPELYVSDEVEERCKKYALDQTRRREAMSTKQAEEQDL